MSDEAERTAAVIADLERMTPETRCTRCAAAICGHELVASHAMGWKRELRCLRCIAAALAVEPASWREDLLAYVQARDCWRAGWRWASRSEGQGEAIRPACLWPASSAATGASAAPNAAPAASWPRCDARWDAGDMACGDLLFDLRLKVRALAPGETIHVIARDSSAPIDMPAWCRLTGHPLRAARHPDYAIERRSDSA